MSRVGLEPVLIPEGVKLTSREGVLEVKGPGGTLRREISPLLDLKIKNNRIEVARKGDTKTEKSLHGLYRSLIANMVKGVTEGFGKTLEMRGVGYRAEVKGNSLVLNIGLSHEVELEIPEGVSVEVARRQAIESLPVLHIIVKGADREAVGQFAADIRGLYPPEPYKGKGIRYLGEYVRRKAGKKAA